MGLRNLLRRSQQPRLPKAVSLDKTEAQLEAGEAISRLQATKELWPGVDNRVGNMRRIREENHLADMIRASLGGGRP